MPGKSPPERAEYSLRASAASPVQLNHHNTWSGFLLRAAMALHDHEICPRLRVLRLFTAPCERGLGNICIGCARKGPLRPMLCLKSIGDGLAVEQSSAELFRREVRPCSLQSV